MRVAARAARMRVAARGARTCVARELRHRAGCLPPAWRRNSRVTVVGAVTVVTVADCERVQAAWFRFRAESLGGRTWSDGSLDWVAGPDGLNLMFPTEIPRDAVSRGVEFARASKARIVGAWLSTAVDASALAAAGFERGWAPWWMTRQLSDVDRSVSPRVEVNGVLPGEDVACRENIALTRLTPARAWHAAAYAAQRSRFTGRAAPPRFAGHSWSFLAGELAGIFDMGIFPRFRRQGLGTELLTAVCDAAAAAGARDAVLNATPEGKPLYEANGFTQIGEGITWWLHLR